MKVRCLAIALFIISACEEDDPPILKENCLQKGCEEAIKTFSKLKAAKSRFALLRAAGVSEADLRGTWVLDLLEEIQASDEGKLSGYVSPLAECSLPTGLYKVSTYLTWNSRRCARNNRTPGYIIPSDGSFAWWDGGLFSDQDSVVRIPKGDCEFEYSQSQTLVWAKQNGVADPKFREAEASFVGLETRSVEDKSVVYYGTWKVPYNPWWRGPLCEANGLLILSSEAGKIDQDRLKKKEYDSPKLDDRDRIAYTTAITELQKHPHNKDALEVRRIVEAKVRYGSL